ncbi:type 1 glutamine amidotransferase domain-containing protein [Natribacillus halophilus]|uniref:Protease I n=1 Tax=Natribacillus halophilus TaxID=549003 RepID=A0A1G8R386_9BACI|nr:type 1 glutamine amidotransferase domain-containing protein [Natribacillus halophilus]SDJ11429.1 protease I [Natribacillus halophilus]
MSHIAVVLTDLFEDVEYTKPAEDFKSAGHRLTTIEKESGKSVTGKQGTERVTVDVAIDDVKPEDFDALFIPGGFSPDQLRADERFVSFARHFMDENKPVFAICHGPQLLITAKALEGRHVTGAIHIRTDLEYAKANVHDEEVVVCHNLVTSRKPDDLPAFTEASLNALKQSV